MFGKLLKHELRSSAPLMLILNGVALFCGFLGMIAMKIISSDIFYMNYTDNVIWIVLPCMLLFYAAYIGLIVCFAASQYIQLFRFYGSRFTDRGYLTFTLPISAHTNFLSAAVNILIWTLVSYVVFFFSINLFLIGGMSEELFSVSATATVEDVPWGMVLAMLFVLSVSPVYSVVVNMTAVVTACSLFKRMKVLGCIGFMYALSMVFGILIAAIMLFCMIHPMVAGNDPMPTMTFGYALMGVVMAFASVGGYFLSVHLMKKKLNLS